ncbi:hypothetical protein A1Q2_06396 [Trichosporon asahii var. asahii CBS 8904]|uniref:Uncharacterized protein n=1 Tax=Trichosporon asahii var. asahii (strain CBS 8904) TaxID=1220162 RepID=K1VJ79_TRIAC|nr:hypothetical protein A1Q2_06396 [Trichosporon asahii var. asahii CBS 8904]
MQAPPVWLLLNPHWGIPVNVAPQPHVLEACLHQCGSGATVWRTCSEDPQQVAMGMENKNVPEWMLRDKHISESRLLQGLRIDSLRLAHPVISARGWNAVFCAAGSGSFRRTWFPDESMATRGVGWVTHDSSSAPS